MIMVQLFGSLIGALLTRAILNRNSFFEAFINLGMLDSSLQKNHIPRRSTLSPSSEYLESVGPELLQTFMPTDEAEIFESRLQVVNFGIDFFILAHSLPYLLNNVKLQLFLAETLFSVLIVTTYLFASNFETVLSTSLSTAFVRVFY